MEIDAHSEGFSETDPVAVSRPNAGVHHPGGRGHSRAPGCLREDIKPQTPIESLDRTAVSGDVFFELEDVSPVVGMSAAFIRKVVGSKGRLSGEDVLKLLDQDAFSETFVPRSKILTYLARKTERPTATQVALQDGFCLLQGDALTLSRGMPADSVRCIVTSTPYWAMRLYSDMTPTLWADGENSVFGLEQTPEGFVRHSIEMIHELSRLLTDDGSIWWNIMDTFNTRTQIRGNAAEALRAMQGRETRGWKDYDTRRYSAGHSYLKDGEQCLIPMKIAERASRLGLYVKSVISWAKVSSLPEPQNSRVSRNVEYILHITKQRSPYFDKEAFRTTPVSLGGRNAALESDKLSDSWVLPTSSGRDGHGAQFPLSLPGRCIAISTKPGDTVLDPFVGSGTAGEASLKLGRKFLGFDTSETYLSKAVQRLRRLNAPVNKVKRREQPSLLSEDAFVFGKDQTPAGKSRTRLATGRSSGGSPATLTQRSRKRRS